MTGLKAFNNLKMPGMITEKMSLLHQLYAPVILRTFLRFQCGGQTKQLLLYMPVYQLKSTHGHSHVILPPSITPSFNSKLHGLRLRSEMDLFTALFYCLSNETLITHVGCLGLDYLLHISSFQC